MRNLHPKRLLAIHAGAAILLIASNLMAQDGELPPRRLPETLAQAAPGPELSPPTESAPRQAKRIALGKSDKNSRLTPLSLDQLTHDGAIVDLTNSAAAQQLAKQHNTSLPKSALAFQADFSAFHKRNDQPQLISVHDGRMTYYNGTHQVVRVDGLQLLSPKTLQKFNLPSSVIPVQLIQDGTTQLLVYRKVKNNKGDTLYKVSLYKLFGRYFGKSFEQTFAIQKADSTIMHTAKIEFLRGEKHPFLRVTPYAPDGQLLTNSAQIMRYDAWEGLFRVPAPVPSAPKRNPSASL